MDKITCKGILKLGENIKSVNIHYLTSNIINVEIKVEMDEPSDIRFIKFEKIATTSYDMIKEQLLEEKIIKNN